MGVGAEGGWLACKILAKLLAPRRDSTRFELISITVGSCDTGRYTTACSPSIVKEGALQISSFIVPSLVFIRETIYS